MWIKELFLAFIGLASGVATSAGVFAFAVTLGVIPRFAGKTHTSKYILSYENAIFLGGSFGTLISLFPVQLPFGWSVLAIYGLSAGIYTGCLAVALTEILDAFPIMFRRTKMKMGQSWVLYAMAFGKVVGSLYFWANHMRK